MLTAQAFPISCLEPFQSLLHELAALVPGDSIMLGPEDLAVQIFGPYPFGLWVSEHASLVLDRIQQEGIVQIHATVNSETLQARLKDWHSHCQGELAQQFEQAIALSERHQTSAQARLIEQLLHTLIQKTTSDCNQSSPTIAACQPIVDAAMTQQLAQESLIHRVTAQIRQSLKLPEILSTAAEQVRQILNVDRFVIYQFQEQISREHIQPLAQFSSRLSLPNSSTTAEEYSPSDCMGTVTYESCRDPSIHSTLNYSEQYCWDPTGAAIQRYQEGEVLAIHDVEETYRDSTCMRSFLATMQVRAKLVVPILVHSELWGLLIAHQCSGPRSWAETDHTFLQQISEHLSVAIAQAQLYQQLNKQKSTLEQQVQQRTQELQEALISVHAANQAKSEFLATMSHELRTPLTCVIGMSATLLRWSLGPLTEKQRTYLQTIHDSGEHLLDLINDILDLSNVEAGKASLNVSEFSISSLSHQSLQMLRDKAHDREIALKAQINLPSGCDRFMADSRRIKQILFNLLSNSIKFTPAGGQVILRVWRESNSAVFQVEDTGIGIPENQQSKLFQKFQQLDTSYRRSYEGTGLGLALVKQFVDMHNGWIEVESEEGKGAIFTVEIPNQTTRSEDGEEKNIESLSRMPLAGSRILLIESQDEQASFICDILTAAGYQVIWMVESGTAFPQVKILQPVLVIIEANATNEDSLSMIRKIKKTSHPHRTKILVLTHENLKDHKSTLLNAGADACLQNPVHPEHLLHRVETVLLGPKA